MNQAIKLAIEEFNIFFMQPDHNHRMKRFNTYFRETGISMDQESRWSCSVFISWVCSKLQLPCGKKDVDSWMKVGIGVEHPLPGDIVMVRGDSRDRTIGHLAFFLEFSEDCEKVYGIGSRTDQSVGVQAFDTTEVLGYRRVEVAKSRLVPHRHLSLGSIGPEVLELQNLLSTYAEASADPPGIFGFATQQALRSFQSLSGLNADGVYGQKTAEIFQRLALRNHQPENQMPEGILKELR